MITGTPKLSGLSIAEVTISFRGTGTTLSAKSALIDLSSGVPYAWIKREQGWSPETVERLAALKESMEADIGSIFFSDGVVSPTREHRMTEPGGLGEHLQEADQL